MQSPPFGILSINNNNPHHTCNPPPKPGQQQGQLAPIPVTNPTVRLADAEEREEQEKRTKTKFWRHQESKSLHGRQPAPSSSPQWTWRSTSSKIQWRQWWWWCICRHFANSTKWGRKWGRGRNGCGSSCHKEAAYQQPLPSWLLQHPSFQFLAPQQPKGPSPWHHPSHQGVVATYSKEKRNWGRV